MEGYLHILKFLDLMTGDLGWIPVAAATFVTALIMDFVSKLKSKN